MKKLAVSALRIKNFKAIRDSGTLKLTPLTVFIGNNGSGKSSIIEALEALQRIAVDGLDEAMNVWRGFEHVWNNSVGHKLVSGKGDKRWHSNPITFSLKGSSDRGAYRYAGGISIGEGANSLFIVEELLKLNSNRSINRDIDGNIVETLKQPTSRQQLELGESVLSKYLRKFVRNWQFVSLITEQMTLPIPQHRTGTKVRLNKDGSNISEYLRYLRDEHRPSFNSMIQQIQQIVSYATDIQPELTPIIERTVYIQLTEGNYKIPSWMLSTGTLRLIALVALLNNPDPPPLIAIEEIENGLDPRSIQLIASLLKSVALSGKTQLIVTTHSPYLLDLMNLEDIVLVERQNGIPVFRRPSDDQDIVKWGKDFYPGKLYTMGKFTQGLEL